MLSFRVSAIHTDYTLCYSLTHTVLAVPRVYTPSHTNKCTHYSLLEHVWFDHSIAGSERTIRVTESPTLFIPAQLSHLIICAARHLKP